MPWAGEMAQGGKTLEPTWFTTVTHNCLSFRWIWHTRWPSCALQAHGSHTHIQVHTQTQKIKEIKIKRQTLFLPI